MGAPNDQLGAIIVGYFALMFLMTVNSGFSTGMSIFKMPDVNFLFAGPFRPVRVLFHGMLNQMGTALIMATVILFQYGWMHGSYGVGLGGLLAVLLGYGLAVFTGQVTAMAIYCLSSGRPKVRRALRAVYVLVAAAWALYVAFRAMTGEGGVLDALCSALVDPVGRWFPRGRLAGHGLLSGDTGQLGHGGPADGRLGRFHRRADRYHGPRADQDYYETFCRARRRASTPRSRRARGA